MRAGNNLISEIKYLVVSCLSRSIVTDFVLATEVEVEIGAIVASKMQR